MTELQLDEGDRRIVESVTARAIAEGAETVARAVQIHRRQLTRSYKDRDRLTSELASVNRAIAMREMSIEKLTR